jgi:DNA-binding MurR/RpiR family transcriptional regulator
MQQLISSKYSSLSPQLQRAARFVVENPEEVATRSLRQIAASIDMSPPTFSRLAGALGYKNYEGAGSSRGQRHFYYEAGRGSH